MHGGHCVTLVLLDSCSGLRGLDFSGGGIGSEGEDGGHDALNLSLVIEVEQPVAEADVLPHEALGSLLLPTADDGGDAVADAHDGAVHFVAE